MSGPAREVEPPRLFSPWGDARLTCATCAHSVGYDGTHLWCEKHRIVVVMPCGAWEREPGADA